MGVSLTLRAEKGSASRCETHGTGVACILHLDKGHTAGGDTDRASFCVGEPSKTALSDRALDLHFECLGVFDLEFEQFVGRAYSDSNLHLPIVTPFQSMGRWHTFES